MRVRDPRDQRRAAEAADLGNLFRAHGTEVHVATEDFKIKPSGKAATADSARRDTSSKPLTPDHDIVGDPIALDTIVDRVRTRLEPVIPQREFGETTSRT